MKLQVEKEASGDLADYDKYSCWCKKNEKEKAAAIETAKQRLEDFSSALEESAAKAEALKTEIAGLGSELAANRDAAATAASLRDKEREAFLAEEADMEETHSLLGKALDALSEAKLLQRGTGGAGVAREAAAVLLQVHDTLARQRGARFLNVMQRDLFSVLGSFRDLARVIVGLPLEAAGSKGRTAALLAQEQLGMGAEPNELQGAAAGVKSYSSRSGQIRGILSEMRDELAKDLAAARKQDSQAGAAFQKLSAVKLTEITGAKAQLEQKEAALAANLDAAVKAKEDTKATEAVLAADQTFLGNMRQTCKAEDQEYQKRLATRSEEIRALGEALSILSEDDARSLYAKTMSFLQLGSSAGTSTKEAALERSAQLLSEAARNGGSWALASLAVRAQRDSFGEVKGAMDKMLAELGKQQKEEYAKREQCNTQIDETEDAIKEGLQLKEDLAEEHKATTNTIETLEGAIEGLESDTKDTEVSLKQAGEERKAQNLLFQSSLTDQQTMIEILNKAMARLQAFYAFSQTETHELRRQEPGASVPAPPPAPKQHRKSAGASPVLQLLAKVIRDAEVAEKALEVSEQQAEQGYAALVRDVAASLEANRAAIAERQALLAEGRGQLSETKEAQLSNGQDLAGQGDLLKAHHIQCNYILEHFNARQKARAEEMDSIREAKAILSGADFGS